MFCEVESASSHNAKGLATQAWEAKGCVRRGRAQVGGVAANPQESTNARRERVQVEGLRERPPSGQFKKATKAARSTAIQEAKSSCRGVGC